MPCCITLLDSTNLRLVLKDEIGIYDLRNNKFNSELNIDGFKIRFNDGK